jgi:hypothetical protein
MQRGHFIALDTHCEFTVAAILTRTGELLCRRQLPTTIPALRQEIEQVPRPRHVVLEEGARADPAFRGAAGDQVDPRRHVLRLRRHALAFPEQAGVVALPGHRTGAATQWAGRCARACAGGGHGVRVECALTSDSR